MAEKEFKPKIRFKGHMDDWEQYKFGDMYEKVSEKNDLSYGTDKIISVANMYFKSDAYISDKEYLRTYNIFKLGDIAFEGNKSKDFAHGRFVENSIGDGIVSHVFDVFRPIREFDLMFWKYAINNERLMRNVLIKCTKSSTMMTNLVANDFLEESFQVPCIEEQKKIGAYFRHLDNCINLYQRKYDKLINVKKSMIEKMFPKSGASVPEIRFKGFIGDWEQCKFRDIVERISTSCATDGLPRVEYEDIVSEQGMLNKDIYQKVSNKSGILFRKNDILYGKLRPYLKNWLLAGFEGIAVGDFWVYRSTENDSTFIYSLIQSDFYQVAANISTGTKMPRADWSVVSNTEFYIPLNVEEQKKIGAFFIDLDNLITLHQCKLEKLKNIKKSMLEKMFL